MEKIDLVDCLDLLVPQGRTLWQGEKGLLHMNWTCSGVEVVFRGTCLLACFEAQKGDVQELDRRRGVVENRPLWPWAAVFVDGEEIPRRRFEVDGAGQPQLLFWGEKPQTHRLRLVKLTENLKTGLALKGFWAEGELLPPGPRPARPKIEFVGDSITCGYGNETTDRDRRYFSSEENGWTAHGSLAARRLGMEWSMICLSGICLAPRQGEPQPYSMRELYPYTDRIQEEKEGKIDLTRWDFPAHPSDYLVLNLGTNDASGILGAGDPGAEEEAFEKDYGEFLGRLRALNGPKTRLICALGPMDYYLYGHIREIVGRYQKDAGDGLVSCLRYPAIDYRDPIGAYGHPHRVTHQKMADALVRHIQAL